MRERILGLEWQDCDNIMSMSSQAIVIYIKMQTRVCSNVTVTASFELIVHNQYSAFSPIERTADVRFEIAQHAQQRADRTDRIANSST